MNPDPGIKSIFVLLLFMLTFLVPACGNNNLYPEPPAGKTAMIPHIEGAGITLDSSRITLFFTRYSFPENIQHKVFQFYQRHDYAYAWVTADAVNVTARKYFEQVKSDSRDFRVASFTNAALDSIFNLINTDNRSFFLNADNRLNLELLLTADFFLYSSLLYTGFTTASKDLQWYIPRETKNVDAWMDTLAVSLEGTIPKEPLNQYYLRLREKLTAYRAIQKAAVLPNIGELKKSSAPGSLDSSVPSLKKYLFLTRDLKNYDTSFIFTDSLSLAIRHYQQRTGLAITGKPGKATLMEMNISIESRIQQIMVNLERLRWAPVDMNNDYVLVNIPEYKLHVFENGQQAWVTQVVVGKEIRQTSIFSDHISSIILNPYWNVPSSITIKEIIPNIRKNASYLSNNDMEIVSRNPLVVRQKPGPGNALGKIKFLFPNNYNIYLHDTPSKNLFGENKRAFSHGCIRVEDPFWLARYLLRKDPSWTRERMDEIIAKGKEFTINIQPAIPVYIAYFTAWVDNTGEINFRKDIYGLDKKIAAALSAKK